MVAERGANARGTRVVEDERGVEELVVVRQIADVAHLGFDVVAHAGLEPLGHAVRTRPSRVGEIAVDGDGAGGAADGEGWAGTGRGRESGRSPERDAGRQEQQNA